MKSLREIYDKDFDSFLTSRRAIWTPQMIYEAAQAYFKVQEESLPTIRGLCLTLGISLGTWARWRSDPVMRDVVEWADMVIKESKYQGCAHGDVAWKFVGADNIQDVVEDVGTDGEPEGLEEAVKAVLGMIDDD